MKNFVYMAFLLAVSSSGAQVTAEDIQASLTTLNAGQIEAVRADPRLLEQVVRSYLVQRLVLEQAKSEGWHEEPHVIAKLKRVRASTLTESYLEKVAQPPLEYPSEAELRQAYVQQREALRVPRSFRLAQIFVTKKLDEVTKRVTAKDAKFEVLAAELSEDAVSASRGGEIGWLTEGQIDKGLLPIVADLKLNAVSKPVRLKDGWHFLKLLDARASYVPTLEQARTPLVQQLRTEKLRNNTQAYLANLLKEHPLTLDPVTLSKALPPQTSTLSGP